MVLLPILQFGQVLYPSRMRAERDFLKKTSDCSEQCVYYIDPDFFTSVGDLVYKALTSDWTSVLAAELLKTSRVRAIKQTRIRRALIMALVSFIVIGAEQFLRSLVMT